MANTSLGSPRGALPVWPFLSRGGGPCALDPQRQPSDQRGPPTLQRTDPSRRVADFSIRSILAWDGSKGKGEHPVQPAEGAAEWPGTAQGCAWIRCTRFQPPSLSKVKRLGSPHPTSRSPRVPFSATQLGTLESSFQQTRYLSTGQVRDVALLLGLTENRVKIWFQNRRARERRDFLKQHANGSVAVNGDPVQDQARLGWR